MSINLEDKFLVVYAAPTSVEAEVGTVARDLTSGNLYFKYDQDDTAWLLISSATGVLKVPSDHATRHKTGGADVLAIANATTTGSTETAVVQASRRNGVYTINNPVAGTVDSVVAAALPADGAAIVVALQPDVPRKLQVDVVDANASISAGTLTIAGLDQNGKSISEQFDITGGTKNLVSTNVFASVTTATYAGVVGAVAPDTVSVGTTDDLGLPGCQVPVASGYAVYLALVDNAREAVGTVDATAGSISPTTAPNGAHDYQFFYTYAVTEVQNAHTHTHAAHTHTIT